MEMQRYCSYEILLRNIFREILNRIAPGHYCKPPLTHGRNNGGRLARCRGQHRYVGNSATHPPSIYKKRRCRLAVGEAHPEHDGPALGAWVPRIRERIVE